jgi:predicted ABC-type ATPase
MSRGHDVTTSGSSASPTSSHESEARRVLWILAGPNGSGKSSLYGETTDITEFGRSVWIINPDLSARRIQQVEGHASDQANLEAVQRIEAWLDASIRAHQTVGVETVSPDRNVERVRLRVAKGGHDVPEERVRARYGRWRNFRGSFGADRAWVFNNSGATPRLISEKRDGRPVFAAGVLSQIVDALAAAAIDAD